LTSYGSRSGSGFVFTVVLKKQLSKLFIFNLAYKVEAALRFHFITFPVPPRQIITVPTVPVKVLQHWLRGGA
jgi:hypothetical protein